MFEPIDAHELIPHPLPVLVWSDFIHQVVHAAMDRPRPRPIPGQFATLPRLGDGGEQPDLVVGEEPGGLLVVATSLPRDGAL